MSKLPIGMLPPDATAILQAASKVGEPGSLERQAAINSAYERVEYLYPTLFKRKETDMKLRLENVRLAFPALFTAKTVNGEGEPAYSATFIFPKNHPAVAQLNEKIDAVAQEKWGAKAAGILEEMRAKDRVALHDGNTKASLDGFKGNMYVAARSKVRPNVVDRDKSQLSESDGKPYGGCYVNASIQLWAQDNQFGKRVNATLVAVQFAKDGDAFGGRVAYDEDDFEDISAGAEADDLV